MKLIENGKRKWILLVCMFVFSQALLANACDFYKRIENKSISSVSFAHPSFITATFVNHCKAAVAKSIHSHTLQADSNRNDEQDFHNSYSIYRKKYKRVQQFSNKIKIPVKVVTTIVPAGEKITYTKPYFLSHLHYFLFRLTPF